jgi:hypothetical protein
MRLYHLVLVPTLAAAACMAGGSKRGDDTGDDTVGDDTVGDDTVGDDDPGPGDPTPQEFIEQIIAADCAKAFACEAEFPATEGTFAEEWGDSEAGCLTDDDDYLARDMIAASVTAGRITYDSSAAADCLANLGYPASCTEFFTNYDWPDACSDAMVGNVADGGACVSWWECSAEGSECVDGACAPATDE